MDELTMIRELLPEPPDPSPQVARAAWESLDRRMRDRSRLSRWRRPGRPILTRPLAAGSLAAGVAAALAVGLAAAGGGGAGDAHPGGGSSEALTGRPARALLLAMAVKAREHQTTTGKYRCTVTVTGQRALIGGNDTELPAPWVDGATNAPASPPAGYQYAIFVRYRTESCMVPPTAHSPGGTVGGYFQSLGARPASKADAAVWRRDGSPDHWVSWAGTHEIVSAHPGPRQWTGPKYGSPSWGSKPLPSDPAKLKARLEALTPGPDSQFAKSAERQGHQTYRQFSTDYLLTRVNEVMVDPVPSAVRAAAFRVLATVPGIRVKPGVTDPEGQTGTAVWLGNGDAGGGYTLYDPATGAVLASLAVAQRQIDGTPSGAVISYITYRSWWTNHLPKFPPRPKGRPTAPAPKG